VANTQLSQKTTIQSNGNTQITFKGTGVTTVVVNNNSEVSVVARPGFSGKTEVTINLKSEAEVSQIVAQVIVLPLPVTNPVVKPVSEESTRVSWIRSPNATGYEVIKDGVVVCVTAKVSCVINDLVTPEAKVEIKALGRDQTESLVKEAKYVEQEVVRVVPDIALVVNFDTAKYNLDAGDRQLIRDFAADVIRFGYKQIDISGHTDSRGGIDNNVLSNNRAKAARDYLLKLVPNLKVTINGFADAISVAPNTTAAGMAANRRAEFRVIG
jgi:outer membrane protein OmpA-like peptidoglycan-associated protein